MLFSDHQNSVKSSPKSGNGISETLNLKISSGLYIGPRFQLPNQKELPTALYSNPNPTPKPILLTDFARQQGSSARHVLIVLGNFWATFCVWSNFFRLEQLQVNFSFLATFYYWFLVAKNGMTPSFSLFGALQLNGLTKKSDNVSS
jgi:hypothetical protein